MALRIRHVLYMSDGPEACARLRRAVPTLACAWSSIINTSKPAHDSVLVRKWWDMRFYFYNVRKHILSRLAGELGYNVMQTDTDVAWFANPYPALKHGPMGEHQLISQPDLPLANAGVVYAQNIKSKSDPAAWVLNELIERIRAFSFHPDIVPRVLPWAKPPYFSNADEQSLMNDVLASAISGQPCFIFSTAIMEVKYGGTKRTKGFVWEKTPEAMTKPKLMALVRSRNERHDYKANACCHPAGLRVCTLPRGSAKRNVSSFSYHLNSWRIGTPPDAARLSAYSSPSSSSSAAATPPSFATAAAAIAAAAAADKAAADADASAAAGASRYAKGPNWLFQHYTHFDAKDAHKPQPERPPSSPPPSRAYARSVLPTPRSTSRCHSAPLPASRPCTWSTSPHCAAARWSAAAFCARTAGGIRKRTSWRRTLSGGISVRVATCSSLVGMWCAPLPVRRASTRRSSTR